MKTTKSVGVLFAIITFLIIVLTLIFSSRINNDNEYTYRIIKIDGGYWGYEIQFNDKIFIHQEHIPAVQGMHRFNSKADAQKVAELLVYRLNNKLSPGISKKDLQELQIFKE
jgi:hypothetical protein